MTEPAAGSDLRGIQSTARRDGEGWLLNGSKTFITNGYSADLVVAAARTPEDPAASACSRSKRDGRVQPRQQARQARPARSRHRRALLRRGPGPGREPDRRGRARACRHMVAHLAQERISTAVVNVAHARRRCG